MKTIFWEKQFHLFVLVLQDHYIYNIFGTFQSEKKMEAQDRKIDQIRSKFTLSIKPYVDSGGWVRVLIKDFQQIKLDYKGTLTPEIIASDFKFKDFGVSDSEETMNTQESWYIENVKLRAGIVTNLPGYPATYLNSEIVNLNQVIANVFNGKTPTGSQWSQNYNEGYLFYQGVIKTYGNFTQFWMGWTQNPYIQIGTTTSLRSGGSIHHTGQFIHSSCNGYKDIDHSITSRWDWKKKRVFWVRP